MIFKITGELINLNDLVQIYTSQKMQCNYIEEKHEIILDLPYEEDYAEALAICADMLGVSVFFKYINEFAEKEKNLPYNFNKILRKETKNTSTLEYIRILTFKTLLDFVDEDDHVDIDSFANFRLSKLKDEAELFIQSILRQCQLQETLMNVNASENKIDMLRKKIESAMEDGIDMIVFMPVFQSIYKILNPEGSKVLTIGRDDDYYIINENNQPIFIDEVLSSIHPNLELEPLPLDSLKKFINDAALLIQIILPQKIIFKKENFEESEVRMIQILLAELPKIIGPLEVEII